MEKVKHTPGPWSVYDGQWGDHSDEEGGGFQIIMGPYEGGGIFTHRLVNYAEGIFPEDKAHEEAKANARLIAAAPEMLEALRDLLVLAQAHYPIPAAKGEIVRARAAIAKAIGQ